MTAPLRQVLSWSEVRAGKHVHVGEYPAVFEWLADRCAVDRREAALVSTSGFLSAAAVRLLDLAIACVARLHNGGDFDPNGLRIAETLLRRYGDSIALWGMGEGDYLEVNSAEAKPLEAEAEQRLRGIAAPALPIGGTDAAAPPSGQPGSRHGGPLRTPRVVAGDPPMRRAILVQGRTGPRKKGGVSA